MKLTIRSGPDRGATIEADADAIVIGRAEDCDLVLHDSEVSRRHARVEPLPDGGAVLTDLDSRNGIFVDGARLEAPCMLHSGDEFRLGDTIVRVDAAQATIASAPAPTVVRREPPLGAPAASGGLWIRIDSGPLRGRITSLASTPLVIGRDAESDLVLPDTLVSRKHAVVRPLPDGGAVLVDLGSRNGTFVEGRQVHGQVELHGGERIRAGDTVLLTGLVDTPAAGTWRVVVDGGSGAGRKKELGADGIVVGRDSSADLVLEGDEVSRRHAELEVLPDGSVVVTDLGSRNGTFVNERRLAAPAVLVGGERIRIADYVLQLERPAGAAATVIKRRADARSDRIHAERRLSPEGLARLTAGRPWVAIGAWLVVLAAGAAAAIALLPGALTAGAVLAGNPESRQADRLLEQRLPDAARVREIVLVRARHGTVDQPAVQSAIQRLTANIEALGPDVVQDVSESAGGRAIVSTDRRTQLLQVVLVGSIEHAIRHVGGLIRTVKDANRSPAVATLITGQASVPHDFLDVSEHDLRTGEIYGAAVATCVLLVVFGTLVASLLPSLLALVSIAVALGLAALLSQATELSFYLTNMTVGMGFALGIDYSLFVLTRYREERRAGQSTTDAIVASGATSSRAVLFSGMTVLLALLGMLIVPDTILRSIGIGAILVAFVSVAVTLTLLPAVLGLLGDRVDALAIPLLARRATGENESRFWVRVVRLVMRRPVVSLLVSVGILVAASVPALDLTAGSVGVSALPNGDITKQGAMLLDRTFGGLATPVQIVVDGDVASAPVQAAITRLRSAIAARRAFAASSVDVDKAGDLALVSAPLTSEPDSPQARAAVKELRTTLIPAAFSGSGARVRVTGVTAQNLDYVQQYNDAVPFVFVFVLGLSFVLLMVAFRSIVVPAKAVLMNLLSVGAAYGLLVLVFQKGVGADLFGFQQVESVPAWVLIFLFAVLFGLSMDYHVFLLSRVREHYNRTGDNAGAVAWGIGSTARIITGAALIMVSVFAGFAAGQLTMFQELGFGLGVALLLDATLVRSVLVPSSMRLLGTRNWYLPSWLSWLPHLEVEAHALDPHASSVPRGAGAEPGVDADLRPVTKGE